MKTICWIIGIPVGGFLLLFGYNMAYVLFSPTLTFATSMGWSTNECIHVFSVGYSKEQSRAACEKQVPNTSQLRFLR